MNEEVERVQVTLAQLEAKVEKMMKWEQLVSNPLFDELITRDFLGDDAVRLTMNIKPKSDDNDIVTNLLMAKSSLSRFVAGILEDGMIAQTSIEENQALQAELDAEVQ